MIPVERPKTIAEAPRPSLPIRMLVGALQANIAIEMAAVTPHEMAQKRSSVILSWAFGNMQKLGDLTSMPFS